MTPIEFDSPLLKIYTSIYIISRFQIQTDPGWLHHVFVHIKVCIVKKNIYFNNIEFSRPSRKESKIRLLIFWMIFSGNKTIDCNNDCITKTLD